MTSAQSQAGELIAKQRWLALATIDDAGDAEISYVPFAAVNGAFGIVVSRLAAHTANLLAQRPASVLIVDDDPQLADSYTRSRFSIDGKPHVHAAASVEANEIWSALETRQGATVQTLRMLPDFTAVGLEPGDGRLVLGFASAHNVAAPAIKELLRRPP